MRCFARAVGALLIVSACASSAVEWTGDKAYHVGPDVIAVTAAGDTVPDTLATRLSALTPPLSACPASLRGAAAGHIIVAVWWSVRPDSSARLLSARSGDAGLTWSAPTAVDTLDRSVTGCQRAAPGIAVDVASGYVHVSYGLVAPEGTGIFFAHSMDSGATFHAPVPILYGEHPGATSVAASGDVVAVVFEDPNGSSARIGLALSHTMGHIFEDRMLPVSEDNGAATQPLVAVTGRQIAIAWREGVGVRTDSVLRVRTGILH